MLEKSDVKKCYAKEECCREVLQKSVEEERCKEVLEKSVVEKCWRRVL